MEVNIVERKQNSEPRPSEYRAQDLPLPYAT